METKATVHGFPLQITACGGPAFFTLQGRCLCITPNPSDIVVQPMSTAYEAGGRLPREPLEEAGSHSALRSRECIFILVWGPGWSSGVCVCVCVCVCVRARACTCVHAQSCLILCNSLNCSPPGFSVSGILQARILEWAAIPFPKSSQTHISLLQVDSLLSEPPGKE